MKSKTEKKKVEKIIEDRTFGLKNKNKSKAVQKYVKGVEQTVKHQGISAARMESEEFERRKNKKKEEEEQALLNALFKDASKMRQEAEDSDEDPSNTVCPYFKQGLCQKGKKCIYSHDLTLDRTEEIDLYVDQRTQLIMNAIGGAELNSLSEDELNKMIGEKERQIVKGCRSQIVCKFFLEAVQRSKYGWNWSCPNNGDRCKYKHCLPPGYKLKRDGGAATEVEEVDIEAKIDEERNNLLSKNPNNPLVTYDVFLKWKEDKKIRKEIEAQKKRREEEKKNKDKRALRTGKELFHLDPTLFVDDEEAADDYEQIEEEEEVEEDQSRPIQEEPGEQGDQAEELKQINQTEEMGDVNE